jgi:mRNA interferase MazF
MITTHLVYQGGVYWIAPEYLTLPETDIIHPYVVIQDDLFNHSRIPTVVVCALTSNLKRGSLPGNIVLTAGEAGLPKPSVVEVSKLSTVEKIHLGDAIGRVSAGRVAEILAGIRFVQRAFFTSR